MNARWLVLLVALVAAPGMKAQTRYQAPGAGRVEVRYGMPIYREELMQQARPGLEWRLGSGSPTVMETTAALVHEKGVIFPGTYTLTARCRDTESWDLRFVEGVQQQRRGPPGPDAGDKGPELPSMPLARSQIEKERDHTKKLAIDVERVDDKEQAKLGGTTFRVRFGPHQLAADFLCIGTDKMRGKLGKTKLELEWLELPAVPPFEDALMGKGNEVLTFARVRVPDDEMTTRLVLEPGEEPTLRFPEFNRSFTGKRSTGSSKASKLDVKLSAKSLTVRLDTTVLEFEIGEDAFTKTETGGATPSKPGDGH